ncbi:hypothetical protein ACQ4PT_019435 [Festuca glaucescens]
MAEEGAPASLVRLTTPPGSIKTTAGEHLVCRHDSSSRTQVGVKGGSSSDQSLARAGFPDETPVLLAVKQEPEEEEELPPPVQEPASKPWGQKRLRMSRDRAFTHLQPGVPRKVRYDSHLKEAAAEVQRRLEAQSHRVELEEAHSGNPSAVGGAGGLGRLEVGGPGPERHPLGLSQPSHGAADGLLQSQPTRRTGASSVAFVGACSGSGGDEVCASAPAALMQGRSRSCRSRPESLWRRGGSEEGGAACTIRVRQRQLNPVKAKSGDVLCVAPARRVCVPTGNLNTFPMARVHLPIDQPLRRWIPLIDGVTDDEVVVNVHYERLPAFCFICGFIGHKDSAFNLAGGLRKKNYKPDLGVPPTDPEDIRR